jgi:lysophospholipase L1-like esterase
MERPFEMVVLGDSILWGTGLADEEKLWTLVRQRLEQRLARPVNVRVLAHSLAVVEPDAVKDAAPPEWGEIRFRHPSITSQALDDARIDDRSAVDLVLVDGGVNDLGPLNFIKPWRTTPWIHAQTAEHCGRKMKNLLLAMLDRFPNARVVVTGYFPIVSDQTWLIRALAPLPPLRRRLIELSAAWAGASEQWLRWAVQQANLHDSEPKPRVLYANPAFGPEHCYGAPDTYLWSLWEAVTDRTPVGKRRRRECMRLKPWDPICPIDRALHPNPRGARAYADAVVEALASRPDESRSRIGSAKSTRPEPSNWASRSFR